MRANHPAYVRIVLSTLVATGLAMPAFGGTTTVFSTDFDGGTPPEISGVTTTEPVQGYAGLGTGSNVFGGSFLINRSVPAAPTSLTLTGLPGHSRISIRFLLAVIDSWDGTTCHAGPDLFTVRVDGNLIFSEVLENSACGTASYVAPPGVELARRENLGFNTSSAFHLDSAYDMGLDPAFSEIPHSGSAVTIEWSAGGEGWQGSSDESWAIENLVVEIDDLDSDGDGVPDEDDICPGGDDAMDSDLDGMPDFCDACPLDDANDADGFCGDVDTCPGGDDNVDGDGDGVADFCDVCPVDPGNDVDGDGICESDDNCPVTPNENQADLDGDMVGDACDTDLDGDGVENAEDNCPFDANSDQADADGDGAGDVCDADSDGDGVIDESDACVPSPSGEVVNADGCAIGELCPCEHPGGATRWKNHGAYVSCVAHAAEDFVADGLISEAEKDAIVSEAGASACGHKNK